MSTAMPGLTEVGLKDYPSLRASGPRISQWTREEFASGLERILATFSA